MKTIALTAEAEQSLRPMPLPDMPESQPVTPSDEDMRMFMAAVEEDRQNEARARQSMAPVDLGFASRIFRESGNRQPPNFRDKSTPILERVYYFPFQLIPEFDDPTWKIRVVVSNLDGAIPDDFEPGDDPHFLLTPSGSGVVYAHIVVDQTETGGDVTSRTIENAASRPANTDTDYYYTIGSYSIPDEIPVVANAAYGPISVSICRDFYALEEPFWGVTITAAQVYNI